MSCEKSWLPANSADDEFARSFILGVAGCEPDSAYLPVIGELCALMVIESNASAMTGALHELIDANAEKSIA